MNDFADFWKRIEARGIRGWLSQHDHYSNNGGCFPSVISVNRGTTILTFSFGTGVGLAIFWALMSTGLLSGLRFP